MKTILIVNNAEPGIKEFTNTIEQIVKKSKYKAKSIEYKECKNYKFDTVTGIIMAGSPQGDDIIEHHLPYFKWIKKSDKPILGICAGHHITGFLYGSEILSSQEPESGDLIIEILNNDPILEGFPKKFKVKQMHNDSVTLPDDFKLLATSSTCKNQLMKHKTKSLYTCQFHPEFYNHQLIRNFINLCK